MFAQRVASRLEDGPLSSLSSPEAQSRPARESIADDELTYNNIQERETPTPQNAWEASAGSFFESIISFLQSVWHAFSFIAFLPYQVAEFLRDVMYGLLRPPTEFFIFYIKKAFYQFRDNVSVLDNDSAPFAFSSAVEIVFISNPIARLILSFCHLLWNTALFFYISIELFHSFINILPAFVIYGISLDGILWLHLNKPFDHSLDAVGVLIVSIGILLPFPLGLVLTVPPIWYTLYVSSTAPRLSEQEQRELRNKIEKTSEVCHAFFVILAVPRFFLALHLQSVMFYFRDLLLWFWHKIRQSRSPPKFPTPFLYVQQWHYFLVKSKNPAETIQEVEFKFQSPKRAIKDFWQKGKPQDVGEDISSRAEGNNSSRKRHLGTGGRSSSQVKSRSSAPSGHPSRHSDTQAAQHSRQSRRPRQGPPL